MKKEDEEFRIEQMSIEEIVDCQKVAWVVWHDGKFEELLKRFEEEYSGTKK